MTKTKLNIESWNRKEHFRFFSAFDDPFFGITTNIDFTTIYLEAKRNSQSFFLYSLHHILTKANETDEFKLRIEEGNSVVKYDTIHVSPTIGREDGTFGFAFFEYIPDRNEFIQQAIQEITRVKKQYRIILFERYRKRRRYQILFYSVVILLRNETRCFFQERRFGPSHIDRKTHRHKWENASSHIDLCPSRTHGRETYCPILK